MITGVHLWGRLSRYCSNVIEPLGLGVDEENLARIVAGESTAVCRTDD